MFEAVSHKRFKSGGLQRLDEVGYSKSLGRLVNPSVTMVLG